MPDAFDVAQLRRETPGCAERIHFNNAGAALMPAPVIAAVKDYFALETMIGGYEAEDERAADREAAYDAIASLVNAHRRNIAFASSATHALEAALSSIPFASGDVILTTRNDYVSNQIQYLMLEQRYGVRLERAPDLPEGGVDPAAMAEMIERHRPRLVSVSHVPTNSGLVQDAAAIGAACREHDVLYLLDACQSIGQMPVDVKALGCDFLTTTARKFLRGPRGIGFLYISDRALEQGLTPVSVDSRGAHWVEADRFELVDDARRFENWEFAWSLILGAAAAARYASALGLDRIEKRIRHLAALLRTGLAEIPGVRVLDRGREQCGIVTIAVAGREPRDIVLALRKHRINTQAQRRDSAVIDYDAKGVKGSVRFSPHAFNTEDEVRVAIEALGRVKGEE